MLQTPLQTTKDWNLNIQNVEAGGFSQALGQHKLPLGQQYNCFQIPYQKQ